MKVREQKTRTCIRRLFLSLSCAYLALLVFAAAAAPLIAPYSPVRQFLESPLLPPLSEGHILGTDDLGRDILSRLVYGSRLLLLCGASVIPALGAGVILGVTAGLGACRTSDECEPKTALRFSGRPENALPGTRRLEPRGPLRQWPRFKCNRLLGKRLTDGLLRLVLDGILSFPAVLLVIVIVSLSGYGLPRLIIATAIVFTPVFARIVRAETQVLMTEGFVEYSRALGTGRTKILFRHILPNMIPGLAVRAVSFFPAAIVIDTSLSFLGLGVQPPEPGWGLILKDAWNYFFEAPHIACFSGAALAAALFSLNFISDALAEKLSRHI